jgi:drug/metabolite transporter (DMT)-like permease
MNNATKGILFALLATLLWSGNMVVASGIKATFLLLVWLLALDRCLHCVGTICFKSTINDFKIIRNHFAYLAHPAVIVFNTLIYFAGKTTSAVNLSLIAISIPLFIVVLSRIIFKEKVSNIKITGIAIIITGVLVLISKGSFQALLQINFAIGDVLMLLACLFFIIIPFWSVKPDELSQSLSVQCFCNWNHIIVSVLFY